MSEISFLKYEGCGNNFVILMRPQIAISKLPDLARRLCQKHLSVGADGLLVLERTDQSNNIHVIMLNPDGSEMGMCGNGARCVALAASCSGWFKGDRCSLQIGGRKVECKLLPDQLVEVDLGIFELESTDRTLELNGNSVQAYCASLGNPHCVIFVPDVEKVELARLGPLVENHAFFPNRTNVEFVEVDSSTRLKVRVWERGAGITLACGSGAAASQVVAHARGFTHNDAVVVMPGGELGVKVQDTRIYLSGPARHVFSGKLVIEDVAH